MEIYKKTINLAKTNNKLHKIKKIKLTISQKSRNNFILYLIILK